MPPPLVRFEDRGFVPAGHSRRQHKNVDIVHIVWLLLTVSSCLGGRQCNTVLQKRATVRMWDKRRMGNNQWLTTLKVHGFVSMTEGDYPRRKANLDGIGTRRWRKKTQVNVVHTIRIRNTRPFLGSWIEAKYGA